MQKTQVRSLVQEDPSCLGVTKPVCHIYWAHVLQLPKPMHLEPKLQRNHCNEKPLLAATREKPAQQWRLSTAKSKYIHKILKMKLPLKNHKRMNGQAVSFKSDHLVTGRRPELLSIPITTHFWRHLLPCAMPGASGGARRGPCQRNQYLDSVPQTLGFHIPERGTQLPTRCYLSKNIKEKVK